MGPGGLRPELTVIMEGVGCKDVRCGGICDLRKYCLVQWILSSSLVPALWLQTLGRPFKKPQCQIQKRRIVVPTSTRVHVKCSTTGVPHGKCCVFITHFHHQSLVSFFLVSISSFMLQQLNCLPSLFLRAQSRFTASPLAEFAFRVKICLQIASPEN